jgi:DNA-directed RNA polymerase specialized sigma subunit
VLRIRALEGQMTHKEISEIFGVTDGHVGRIISRHEWCWL